MLSIRFMKRGKKSRKYPLRIDEYGRSARQRAFLAFDRGLRPAQVAREVEDVKRRTIYRYFEHWKKLPPNLDRTYGIARTLLKSGSEFSEELIKLLAGGLGMSEEEVIERLEKPWGIKQSLMGRWPNRAKERRQSKQEERLKAALMLIAYVEKGLLSPHEVIAKLEELRNRAQ